MVVAVIVAVTLAAVASASACNMATGGPTGAFFFSATPPFFFVGPTSVFFFGPAFLLAEAGPPAHQSPSVKPQTLDAQLSLPQFQVQGAG